MFRHFAGESFGSPNSVFVGRWSRYVGLRWLKTFCNSLVAGVPHCEGSTQFAHLHVDPSGAHPFWHSNLSISALRLGLSLRDSRVLPGTSGRFAFAKAFKKQREISESCPRTYYHSKAPVKGVSRKSENSSKSRNNILSKVFSAS